jgi:hypothetical protein
MGCHIPRLMRQPIFMTKGRFNNTQITYDTVVPVLMQNGYDGYTCNEYEGQRVGGVEEIDEVDEVRRHQLMLKRLIG